MVAMSLPFTGSYDQTMKKLDHLMGWLLRVGHPYSETPRALYYDDPSKVPEDELRAEVCLPIEEECEPRDEFKRIELPAVTVAYATHEGPYSRIPQLYEEIFEWIRENGYRYIEDMPTREVFLKTYGQTDDPEQYVTEVQVPVEKVEH
jgi:effector-binding domain-containing protein